MVNDMEMYLEKVLKKTNPEMYIEILEQDREDFAKEIVELQHCIEDLRNQLQQKENIIKEVREEMENAKHISIDDSKAIIEHEKRILEILEKENK